MKLSPCVKHIALWNRLSMWNVNLTSVGAEFNAGGGGRLEYYSAAATQWMPMPLTMPFPYVSERSELSPSEAE